MRIVIDYELCASTGMCTSFAPDVFQLEADGSLTLLRDEATADIAEAVQAAVDACPTEAISLA